MKKRPGRVSACAESIRHAASTAAAGDECSRWRWFGRLLMGAAARLNICFYWLIMVIKLELERKKEK